LVEAPDGNPKGTSHRATPLFLTHLLALWLLLRPERAGSVGRRADVARRN
jgi:hypothetical protein